MQLHLACPVELAQARNTARPASSQVPAHVIPRMADALEVRVHIGCVFFSQKR